MFLADKLTFDKPKRTKEGFLAVRAKAARAGVYDYRGIEIDPEGKHFAADQVVKVYRPEDEVFAKDAVHSFLLKPITDDHPTEPVTADNWKTHAKGVNAGAIRDGEYLAFDLVLMDAAAIKAVDAGKRELSNGYTSEIEIGDGTAPDGTAYQAIQRNIRGNHVAIVDKGRAGPECRIGDCATCDAATVELIDRLLGDGQTYRPESDKGNLHPARRETSIPGGGLRVTQDGDRTVATKTILIDGYQFEADAALEVAVTKLQNQLKDANEARTKAEADVAKLTTDLSTKDAEIVTLNKKLDDAKVTPAQLRDAAKAFAVTLDQAKKLAPDIEIKDDMDEAAVRKAVVGDKLGDAAKDWSDEQIAISFATLAKDVKVEDEPDALRTGIRDSVTNKTATAEVAAARKTWLADKQTAYRPQPAA